MNRFTHVARYVWQSSESHASLLAVMAHIALAHAEELSLATSSLLEASSSVPLIAEGEHEAVEAEHAMPVISIKAEGLFHIGPLEVTNSILLGSVTAFLLLFTAILVNRSIKQVPGKLQSIFELFMEGALSLMDGILGSREKSERYLPIVGSIFFFILFSNWLGLFPITQIMFGGHIPLFRAPTADLNFTIALAIISVLSVNILGAVAIGLRGHLGKFFNFGKPFPIMLFVGLLELVSEFVKIVSFSFRLFGNIFAGEVLLTIVAFLVPYVVPLPFLFLEVFVGFIQALIFSMLTLVFLGMSTVAHEAHEEAH